MQSYDNEILWNKYPQEAHVVTWNRTFDATHDNMNLASNQPLSYNRASSGSVNHKECVSSKPIRRRSRASRKTPTTLLNANLSNFRALVQQFTGCHSAPSTCYKGPVTLNFQRRAGRHSDNHGKSHIERSEQSLVSFGATNFINKISTFTSDIDPVLASTVAVTEYAPSEGDPFMLENLDMENLPGEYSTSSWP